MGIYLLHEPNVQFSFNSGWKLLYVCVDGTIDSSGDEADDGIEENNEFF